MKTNKFYIFQSKENIYRQIWKKKRKSCLSTMPLPNDMF